MISKLKKRMYFVIAAYFGFWAKIVLWRWRPRIIVITGSSGKTTLLHLVEAQLGEAAVYSHHANSSFGIPFHILGLPVNIYNRWRWPIIILLAPLKVFRPIPIKKLYVVEADCDRPHEGKFLANLLQPEAVLWLSVYRTHTMNFDTSVSSDRFKTHEQAIAHEFGYFVEYAQKLVIINGDVEPMKAQLKRSKPSTIIKQIHISNLKNYKIAAGHTIYTFKGGTVEVPGLNPEAMAVSLDMVQALLEYLNKPLDKSYYNFKTPPGRSNVLIGKHNVTIVDSTYNTGLDSTDVILQMYNDYPAKHKWLVMGDILEQGSVEREEHERLADAIAKVELEQIILIGPRTRRHTLPLLGKLTRTPVTDFEYPTEVLEYLQANIKGGETVLFKGGRYLEGVIEQLLADPHDSAKLVRREPVWVKKRQKWGLPK